MSSSKWRKNFLFEHLVDTNTHWGHGTGGPNLSDFYFLLALRGGLNSGLQIFIWSFWLFICYNPGSIKGKKCKQNEWISEQWNWEMWLFFWRHSRCVLKRLGKSLCLLLGCIFPDAGFRSGIRAAQELITFDAFIVLCWIMILDIFTGWRVSTADRLV